MDGGSGFPFKVNVSRLSNIIGSQRIKTWRGTLAICFCCVSTSSGHESGLRARGHPRNHCIRESSTKAELFLNDKK